MLSTLMTTYESNQFCDSKSTSFPPKREALRTSPLFSLLIGNLARNNDDAGLSKKKSSVLSLAQNFTIFHDVCVSVQKLRASYVSRPE